MSEREKEILEIIKTFIKENGYSPTVREICSIANIKSTSTVHWHIQRLKAKGHITNGVDMPRSIALTKKEKNVKFIVNAIALMCEAGKEYILLEENKKQHDNDIMFELPGGVIRESENVYGCLRRELNDKGFKVTKIFGEDKCNELSNEDETFTVFKPFCVSKSDTERNSIITNTILCEIDNTKVKRANNKSGYKWVCTDDIESMLIDQKENISAHNIAALRLFCKSLKSYIY